MVEPTPQRAEKYEFRRTDRISKEQMRAISGLHENLARSLSVSVSTYLRAYVAVRLLSIEQIAFQEFVLSLPAPTSLVALDLSPFEANAVLEISPSLVFPVLEVLLGGSGKVQTAISREITEIEQSVFESFLRIVVHDLRASWRPIAELAFRVVAQETEPTQFQGVPQNEAVIAVSLEVKMGESIGMMNLAIPSIVVKMLRQRIDQQSITRRAEPTEVEQRRNRTLLDPGQMLLDARLEGLSLPAGSLASLDVGDVLLFDLPAWTPLTLSLNGVAKFNGEIRDANDRQVFYVNEPILDE